MNPSANGGIYSGGDNTPIVSQPSEPVVVGGGSDMSLSSQKSKKGWIIGSIAAIAVLAVILVVVIIIKNGGFGGGEQNRDTGYTEFMDYANFLLKGAGSTGKNLGEYDESGDYAVIDEYIDENKDYFDRAQELWKAFYDKVTENGVYDDESKTIGDIEYQNELMDFIVKYMATKEWTEESLVQMYASSGLDGASAQLEKDYQNLTESIYQPGRLYAKSSLDVAKANLKLYSEYDALGCLVNGNFDDGCLDRNEDRVFELTEQYLNEKGDIYDEIPDETIDELIENCYEIRDDLESK